MIIEWFKRRIENINQRHKENLLQIEKEFASDKNIGSHSLIFEKEILRIFTVKKGEWRVKNMEDGVFNRLVKNMIVNMSQNVNFRNEIYSKIWEEGPGKQTSFFYLLLTSSHRLNNKTKDYFLRAFPLESYFKLYLRNPDLNVYMSPLRLLLKNSAGDFFNKVCEYHGIANICNASKIWASDGVNVSNFMDEFVEFASFVDEGDLKNNKFKINKINYLINTITKESLSLETSTLQNQKRVFLGSLSSINTDYIRILMTRGFVEKEDVRNIVSSLLSKYERSSNSPEENVGIIEIIKNLFDTFDADESLKKNCICFPVGLTKKTYDMWLKEFTEKPHDYERMHSVLVSVFFNTAPEPDMKLFNLYLNEINDADDELKEKIIFDFYTALCDKSTTSIFTEHMEIYLDYFYYNCNYDTNDFLRNKNDEIMSLPTHLLMNGAEFKTEHINLLKEYEFDPFKKYTGFSSFYELASPEIKNDIANIYIKELAGFERDKIMAIIDGKKDNSSDELSKVRKRL